MHYFSNHFMQNLLRKIPGRVGGRAQSRVNITEIIRNDSCSAKEIFQSTDYFVSKKDCENKHEK